MSNSIFIVIGVICVAMFTGWIFSLASQPTMTMTDFINDHNVASTQYTPGTTISSPTGETGALGSVFGFVLDIPIIGQILSFVSWIITTLIDMIANVVVLPGFFPDWMSPVFVVFFLGFIVYVYWMLSPMKNG